MNKDKVFELIGKGLNCSQVVLSYFSDFLGLDENISEGIAKAFESGMFKGNICGVCSGAYMVLGYKYNNCNRDEIHAIIDNFNSNFINSLGSNICEDLLGINISTNDNFKKAMDDGTIRSICPNAIITGISILENMLNIK